MGKRFRETTIWSKVWYRKLKPYQKCFVDYLFDNCDNAGVWEIDLETASYFIGENIENPKEFLPESFQIIEIDNKNKWFLPKFLTFQYPKGLNSQKPAIIGIRTLAEKHKLTLTINKLFGNDYLMVSQSLENDSLIIKDKDKEKEKDLEKDEDLIIDGIEKEIADFFGFNEIKHYQNITIINAFTNLLQDKTHFEQQFSDYKEFINIRGKRYQLGFEKYLGTPSDQFKDGKWNSENWAVKLATEKSKGKKGTRINHDSDF